MADYAQPEKRAEERVDTASRRAVARKAVYDEADKVGIAFNEATNLLSLLMLDEKVQSKTQMLPRRRRFNDHIMVEETTNGTLLLRLGCNLWAFNDPTELCVVLCMFLRNPEQMSRISEVLTRRDGYEVNGIMVPTPAPVPEVATGRGTW